MVSRSLSPATPDLLLEVRDLHTHFFTDEGIVRSVDGVSFAIPRGKTLCIVGESGSGKSVTARSIMQIVDAPGRIVGGEILFRRHRGDVPVDIAALGNRGTAIRAVRGADIAMIFQEPMTSLSPVHSIGNQIAEALRLHVAISKSEARKRVVAMLDRVGIPRAGERFDAYPFQLSGGQRQRAMIAMALVCEPMLLIADEPTTALDVTTQANILDLILDLQSDMGMSVLFITHDLGVVAEVADEVAVMYLGRVVEQAPVDAIFHDPRHPYTRALLRSVPGATSDRRRLETIDGIVPHPLDRPPGCPFHTRCRDARPGLCDRQDPALLPLDRGLHRVACFLAHPDEHIPAATPVAEQLA